MFAVCICNSRIIIWPWIHNKKKNVFNLYCDYTRGPTCETLPYTRPSNLSVKHYRIKWPFFSEYTWTFKSVHKTTVCPVFFFFYYYILYPLEKRGQSSATQTQNYSSTITVRDSVLTWPVSYDHSDVSQFGRTKFNTTQARGPIRTHADSIVVFSNCTLRGDTEVSDVRDVSVWPYCVNMSFNIKISISLCYCYQSHDQNYYKNTNW